jgi:hypothetical protein
MASDGTLWVLELGAEENGPEGTRQWRSDGYYVGYTAKGPVTVGYEPNAYRFAKKEYAENVRDGDARFKGGRVIPAQKL